MKWGKRVGLGALCLSALPVIAGAPDSSLRPVLRPVSAAVPSTAVQSSPELSDVLVQAAVDVAAVEAAYRVETSRQRPQTRPPSDQMIKAAAIRPGDPRFDPAVSLRPLVRPKAVEEKVLFGKRKRRKGSVCGNIDIQGKPVGRVPGALQGCGVQDAVQITEVSGVKLSRPATMTCETAQALNRWVAKSAKPAFRRRGQLVELQVAAGYSCRTRNNRPGAKISEHGKGKAIDISAFVMGNGKRITVLKSWGSGPAGRALKGAWKGACGPFGTVLGPNADRYHRDHFHFDTARHRGGPYCR